MKANTKLTRMANILYGMQSLYKKMAKDTHISKVGVHNGGRMCIWGWSARQYKGLIKQLMDVKDRRKLFKARILSTTYSLVL